MAGDPGDRPVAVELDQFEPHEDDKCVVVDVAVDGLPVSLVASAPLRQGGITLVLRLHELPWHVGELDDSHLGDDDVRDGETVIVDDGLQVADLFDGRTVGFVVGHEPCRRPLMSIDDKADEPASQARTVGGRVGAASALTFTNRTTADGLGADPVSGVYVVGSTVYAATTGGLSISTNGGVSFTNDDTTSGLGSSFVNGVYATDDTVYAATAPTSDDSGGLSISTNGGASFSNRTTANGLGSNDVFGVYAVGSTVYAATTPTSDDSGGLSISTDGGASFTNRTTDDSLGSNTVIRVYVTDDTVYAATTGGLSISTDGGATFTNRTYANSGLGSTFVWAVYAVGSTVYAGTLGGVSISTNGGATFTNRTTSNSGLGSNGVEGVYVVGSTVYAATDAGMSISTDGGASFTNYTTADGLGSNDVFGVYAVGSTVYAATNAGLSISNAPPPPPVFPPMAPRDVVGVPGDREVGLSWTAPADAGSFPISTYQAVVSPGGQTCLVASPAVTCTISGLRNGTTYTATVRALSGAGWGAYSAASAAFSSEPPVTPSITITGTRTEVRGKPGVVVTGTTTGFGMGAILRPWTRFPGQTSYTQGAASILVDVQGGFTWERRTGKTIYISIRSEDGKIESNRLVVRAT